METVVRKTDKYNKSNIVICSYYAWDIYANKLMGCIFANIGRLTKSGNGTYEMQLMISEIIKLFNSGSNTTYDLLKNAATQICQPICISDDENKRFRLINLFSEINYQNGVFNIEISESMLPYICGMKSRYTKFSLEMMLKFKSIYAFRMYEILKSDLYKLKGDEEMLEIEKDIFELRFLLGTVKAGKNPLDVLKGNSDYENAFVKIYEKDEKNIQTLKSKGHSAKEYDRQAKYPEFRAFNQKILENSVNEINELTDLTVEYRTGVRTRDGIKTIIFTLKKKGADDDKHDNNAALLEKVTGILNKSRLKGLHDLDEKNVSNIIKASNGSIEKIKTGIKVTEDANNVESPVGFLISAIKNNYIPKKKSSFHFENEREYDFEELERKLANRFDDED